MKVVNNGYFETAVTLSKFRLQSAPMIHTPGMIRWLTSCFSSEDGYKLFVEMYPEMDNKTRKAIWAKCFAREYSLEDDGETVVVEVEVK